MAINTLRTSIFPKGKNEKGRREQDRIGCIGVFIFLRDLLFLLWFLDSGSGSNSGGWNERRMCQYAFWGSQAPHSPKREKTKSFRGEDPIKGIIPFVPALGALTCVQGLPDAGFGSARERATGE